MKRSLKLAIIALALISGCVSNVRSDFNGARLPKVSHSLDDMLLKANLAYEEGRLPDAERWFLNIVHQYSSLADAWFKLGNIYYRTGRYTAAINAYETVLTNDISYDKAWYNLALTRRSQSIEVLNRGLSHIDKDSPFYMKSLILRKKLIGEVRIKKPGKGNDINTTIDTRSIKSLEQEGLIAIPSDEQEGEQDSNVDREPMNAMLDQGS